MVCAHNCVQVNETKNDERNSSTNMPANSTHQEFVSVIGVCCALDQGGGRHRGGLNHLGGQENGRRAQQLELFLLEDDGAQEAVHDVGRQEEHVHLAPLVHADVQHPFGHDFSHVQPDFVLARGAVRVLGVRHVPVFQGQHVVEHPVVLEDGGVPVGLAEMGRHDRMVVVLGAVGQLEIAAAKNLCMLLLLLQQLLLMLLLLLLLMVMSCLVGVLLIAIVVGQGPLLMLLSLNRWRYQDLVTPKGIHYSPASLIRLIQQGPGLRYVFRSLDGLVD